MTSSELKSLIRRIETKKSARDQRRQGRIWATPKVLTEEEKEAIREKYRSDPTFGLGVLRLEAEA